VCALRGSLQERRQGQVPAGADTAGIGLQFESRDVGLGQVGPARGIHLQQQPLAFLLVQHALADHERVGQVGPAGQTWAFCGCFHVQAHSGLAADAIEPFGQPAHRLDALQQGDPRNHAFGLKVGVADGPRRFARVGASLRSRPFDADLAGGFHVDAGRGELGQADRQWRLG